MSNVDSIDILKILECSSHITEIAIFEHHFGLINTFISLVLRIKFYDFCLHKELFRM